MRPTREPVLTQCGVQTRRWVNQGQPQTLVIATFLLYFDAVWALLGSYPGLGTALFGEKAFGGVLLNGTADLVNQLTQLAIVAGGAAAGYFISNEKKIGWYLGIGIAALPLVTTAIIQLRFGVLDTNIINIMFAVALLVAVLHDQSRNYVRIWFK